ncbi:nucleocapsid [Wenzhou Crab Virus 1]|uniref:Nucleocapsid n=1 Tax=Wenzhou Crab Virus 1 TaxID=1608091 RepID=A0A0B5KTI5_9MONO|nr:nucleocapsid [Wenzhou Crab Virus 1]AJG39152.1 nucleocapsid [Wenzhou Crab Virus 1]
MAAAQPEMVGPFVKRQKVTASRPVLPPPQFTRAKVYHPLQVKNCLFDNTVSRDIMMSALYHTFSLSGFVLYDLFEPIPGAENVDAENPGRYYSPPTAQEITAMKSASQITKDLARQVNLGMTIAAYAVVANLHKEIDDLNWTYIQKRMTAVGASLNIVELEGLSETDCKYYVPVGVLQETRMLIRNAQQERGLIEDVMTSITDQSTDFEKAIHSSLTMVLKGYGMTAVDQMAYFCTIVTKALTLDVVLDEAENFKGILHTFKQAHGDNWLYGRVLKLAGIDNLNSRNFPHLYYCAITRAQGPSKNQLKSYRASTFDLKESPSLLERYALSDLSGKKKLTQPLIDRIKNVTTIDLAASLGEDIDK